MPEAHSLPLSPSNPAGAPATDPRVVFERHRPRLFALAYRMLGTRADAEDAVQDAYLRWHAADRAALRNPAHWLVTVVSRLCVVRLRRAASERAAYVGPWLPEPLPADVLPPDHTLERNADLSYSFVALLERLGPEERAAFLLRELFDVPYADLAALLGKSEPMCRQMVHRAHERVRHGRPRRVVPPEVQHRFLDRFLAALHRDDPDALLSLFAETVTFTSDGGNKVHAARKVLEGPARIARFLLTVHRKFGAAYRSTVEPINGHPAVVSYWLDGSVHGVTAVTLDGDRITAIYRILNPDKLRNLPPRPTLAHTAS